jgi:hypothetical protein
MQDGRLEPMESVTGIRYCRRRSPFDESRQLLTYTTACSPRTSTCQVRCNFPHNRCLHLLLGRPISPDAIEPSNQEPFDVRVQLHKKNDYRQAEYSDKRIHLIEAIICGI